jgi:hypothetical protein
MRTTEAPPLAAAMAAQMPAIPPPTTQRSAVRMALSSIVFLLFMGLGWISKYL